MKIDPKDLVPMPLNDFRPGGNFYLLEENGAYTRVAFYQLDFIDPHARALIWCWMEENKSKLFINRCNPWGTFER
jgi:hypothetical protein